MRLSAVRELIAQIKEEPVVPEPIATALGLTSVPRSVRTRLAATHTRAPLATSIAVGIASGRSRGDFRLGARVQLAGSQAQQVAEQIRRKARLRRSLNAQPVCWSGCGGRRKSASGARPGSWRRFGEQPHSW